jgi:serine phosphatase RsbU (regulator of sigma subunit)
MTLVNAGHPAGFLVRDAAPVALESTRPPLALLPEPRYEALSVDLFPGDLGVFVTDGVTEALEGGNLVFMASDQASGMTGTVVNLSMGSLDD